MGSGKPPRQQSLLKTRSWLRVQIEFILEHENVRIYLRINSPLMCLLTNVVFPARNTWWVKWLSQKKKKKAAPTPPSPTRRTLNCWISLCIMVERGASHSQPARKQRGQKRIAYRDFWHYQIAISALILTETSAKTTERSVGARGFSGRVKWPSPLKRAVKWRGVPKPSQMIGMTWIWLFYTKSNFCSV